MDTGEVWIKEEYTNQYGKVHESKIYIIGDKTKSKAGVDMFIVDVISKDKCSSGVFTLNGIEEFTKPDRNHRLPDDEAAKYLLRSI